jgi:hypothetical protein
MVNPDVAPARCARHSPRHAGRNPGPVLCGTSLKNKGIQHLLEAWSITSLSGRSADVEGRHPKTDESVRVPPTITRR